MAYINYQMRHYNSLKNENTQKYIINNLGLLKSKSKMYVFPYRHVAYKNYNYH